MASDLIYREDAKDFVRHAYHKGLNPVEYLDEVPVADVRPVVRGKWEVGGMFDDIGRCSCCHYMFPSDTAMTEFRFCPNCGADMRPYKDGRRGENDSG